jgi:hypothetical protein
MEEMKLYTLEEALDEHFGPIGTPRRDEHEAQVAEAVHQSNNNKAADQLSQAGRRF